MLGYVMQNNFLSFLSSDLYKMSCQYFSLMNADQIKQKQLQVMIYL